MTGRWDEQLIEWTAIIRHEILNEISPTNVPTSIEFQTAPSAGISAGGIARSILAGFFALDETLQDGYPQVASSILTGEAVTTWPKGLQLLCVATFDLSFRVTSGEAAAINLSTTETVTDFPRGVIQFPPFIWALSDAQHTRPHIFTDLSAWASMSVHDETTQYAHLLFGSIAAHPPGIPIRLSNVQPGGDPNAWIEQSRNEES